MIPTITIECFRHEKEADSKIKDLCFLKFTHHKSNSVSTFNIKPIYILELIEFLKKHAELLPMEESDEFWGA